MRENLFTLLWENSINSVTSEEIYQGVFLTDASLMTPIKSVSFVINIGNGIHNSRWENRCRSCEDRGQCTYRMK
jgi:hypothetical protein